MKIYIRTDLQSERPNTHRFYFPTRFLTSRFIFKMLARSTKMKGLVESNLAVDDLHKMMVELRSMKKRFPGVPMVEVDGKDEFVQIFF